MEDRLNQIAERLRQVERELADPAVYSDQQRLKNLSREQKELTPVVENFTALQQTEQAIAEAREMLSDPELRELAQEELTRSQGAAGAAGRGAEAPAAAQRPQR